MSVYVQVACRCPRRTEGHQFLCAEVTGGCEPPHKDAKTELRCSARTGSSLNR